MKTASAVGILMGVLLPFAGESAAQTVGVEPVTLIQQRPVGDSALINAVNNFILLGEGGAPKAGTSLAVRVVEVPGETGSAKDGESDQVVSWLYIAVSEFGEAPRQSLFRLGPLFAPKLDSLVTQRDSAVAFVSYGLPAKPQHARIAVTLDRVRVTAVR